MVVLNWCRDAVEASNTLEYQAMCYPNQVSDVYDVLTPQSLLVIKQTSRRIITTLPSPHYK